MTDQQPPDDDSTRMPLRQHLEELRSCLFRSTVCFVLLFVVGLVFTHDLVRFVVLPYEWSRQAIVEGGDPDPGALQQIAAAEGVLFSMKVAGSLAILLGAPIYLWELWRFVGAGLHSHEKAAVRKAFPPAVLLFLFGLAFGFLVVLRLALPLLLTWLDPAIARPNLTVNEYFGTTVNLTLLMGFVFELPIIMWLLVRAGLMRYETLAQNRKTSLVIMLIFAAVMTPPDVITQVLVAIPMAGLYEVGLILARRAEAARLRAVL